MFIKQNYRKVFILKTKKTSHRAYSKLSLLFSPHPKPLSSRQRGFAENAVWKIRLSFATIWVVPANRYLDEKRLSWIVVLRCCIIFYAIIHHKKSGVHSMIDWNIPRIKLSKIITRNYEPQLMQPSCIVHTGPVTSVASISKSLFWLWSTVGITGSTWLLPCFSTVNCTAWVAACERR